MEKDGLVYYYVFWIKRLSNKILFLRFIRYFIFIKCGSGVEIKI